MTPNGQAGDLAAPLASLILKERGVLVELYALVVGRHAQALDLVAIKILRFDPCHAAQRA
jgi:hypothetical protein